MFGFRRKQRADGTVETPLTCSFCNKSQAEVQKLIAGPTVFICNECVEVCNDILADDIRVEALANDVRVEAGTLQAAPAFPCALCQMPTLLEDAVVVPQRGGLCPGCVGEIEAAIAERRRSG